jgi:hypothetical protein
MIIVYIVLGIVVLFLLLSMIGPKDYTVTRSITINKARSEVYDHMKSLVTFDEWSPWAKRDPNMEKTFRGTDGEVGFVSHWKGNKQVGEGEQEIVKLVENERIEMHLTFLKPFKAESDTWWDLTDDDEGTLVTWGIYGENKSPIQRVMGLVMNMDSMMGKDFNQGLKTLKQQLEGS